MDEHATLTSQQKAAKLTEALCAGAHLTVADVMRITGLRRAGAYRLLGLLSGSGMLPLYNEDGHWGLLKVQPQ